MRRLSLTLLCAPLVAAAQSTDPAPQAQLDLVPAAPAAQQVAGTWSSFWWGDYDADGLADAYVIQPPGAGRLLRNRGDGSFEDLTECSGLSSFAGAQMALWSDVDGDRRQDLFLLAYGGGSRLLRQGDGGTFVDVTELSSLDAGETPIDAHWFDYDADGRPDLLLSTTRDERLFHNLGGLRFESIDLGLAPRWTQTGRGTLGSPATIDEARVARGLQPVGPRSGGGSQAAPAGPGVATAQRLLPPAGQIGATGWCAPNLIDFAFPSSCLTGSSIPTLGMLYPLSVELFVDGGTGHVGLGTLTPGTQLDVVGGDIRTDAKLISTAGAGPPLAVSSAVRVTNLNADFLDGLDSTVFSQLGSSIEGAEITDGTIGAVDIAWPLTGSGIPEVVRADATGAGGTAIIGRATASTGPGHGVRGIASSPGGMGVEGVATATTAYAYGVHGLSSAPAGAGVLGEVDSTTGSTWGVAGLVNSPDGAGVYGESVATSGAGLGVHGKSDSASGTGVRGEGAANGVYGSGATGVRGESSQTFGSGVFGYSTGMVGRGVDGLVSADGTSVDGELSAGVHGSSAITGNYTVGVYGETDLPYGTAIHARAWATTGGAKGLYAQSDAPSGDAVYGRATDTSGAAWGVRGETASSAGYGVHCSGNFAATGTKSFVQPHPADAGKELRFVCLEGNESGTYFRGSGRVENGTVVIEVPEEFRLVTSIEGLTAMLTAVGSPARLWIASKNLEAIVVHADMDTDFDYFVNGVRLGFEEHQPIQANQSFVPSVRGVEFGTQYPDALRRILVENGTLNADFTPNELTAGANGWQLSDPAAPREGSSPLQTGPAGKPVAEFDSLERD